MKLQIPLISVTKLSVASGGMIPYTFCPVKVPHVLFVPSFHTCLLNFEHLSLHVLLFFSHSITYLVSSTPAAKTFCCSCDGL